jgi:PAS domain S-box-containing protein
VPPNSATDDSIQACAELLYEEQRDQIARAADRMFAWLMLAQWALGICFALLVSPYSWEGGQHTLHVHVYAALFLGGALSGLPVALAWLYPGKIVTRHLIAFAQMLWSALLIHLTGGRIETHFHVFGSLAFLAFYRDWRVLPTASAVVVVDHLLRGIFWPESVYGIQNPEWWRFLEHAAWVVFEDAVLIVATLRVNREMREDAWRRAEIKSLTSSLERRVNERTWQLAQAQAIAHIGSWEWNLDSNSVMWTDELYRIFGLDRASFQTTTDAVFARIHPEDAQRVRDASLRTMHEGVPADLEYRIVRPDGTVRHLRTWAHLITEQRRRMVGVAQDVTERKQLEESLIFADRMTSVGTLAAGVAHEMNNPLAFVHSNLVFARDEIARCIGQPHETADPTPAPPFADADLEEVKLALDEALEGAERVRFIVRDLKTFSRADSEEVGEFDVIGVLDFAVKMASNHARHVARFEKDLPDLPPVHGNSARLGQVFLNLIINAIQALPPDRASENVIRISARPAESGGVCIEVQDNGTGIPLEIRRRIFDPFFTTKPVGIGTGLGLSICHNIVSSMGGSIQVESEVGRGSLFRVRLPPAPVDAIRIERPVSDGQAGTRRSVLIIDDEPRVLAGLARLLSRSHHVETATGALPALDLIGAGRRYDAILCDVMMPQMSGTEFHDELRRLASEQVDRLAFLTGGVPTSALEGMLVETRRPVVSKPCDSHQLLAVIRSLAERGRAVASGGSSAGA